jgi:phosphoadenosine phosphosulfate reductase
VQRVAERGTSTDSAPAVLSAAEIETANAELEGASALEVFNWAFDRYGTDLVVASSFQDAVLIDLAVRVEPKALVIFLDTKFHFPETLAYMRHLREIYDLNLAILEPAVADDVSVCGTADCCERRKVDPLNALLSTRPAWATGLKRVDTPERAEAPIVSLDVARGVVKVNPIAAWTDDDVDNYITEHDLATHPLWSVGYYSIGCAPTTRPIAEGEDPRAGRWPGSDKTECGLHI